MDFDLENTDLESVEELRIYDLAVYGRMLCKSFGFKNKRQIVLDNLNITVKKGCIYGLLGPSGCGKTTLLKCIVGCRKLDSGDIWVLGGQPGVPSSGVPGPKVGYMPQEVGLLTEYTVKEAIIYAARIAGMSFPSAHSKFRFLTSLLDLPYYTCVIKNLSCGEQRRISLAVALVHEPELLILDEPTVGVDPLTTSKIWEHLARITQEENKSSVIITTHYIEEANQASVVGIMRGGKLLTEISPIKLLEATKCTSLEDAFVYLSYRQENNDSMHDLEGQRITVSPITTRIKSRRYSSRAYRFRALLNRNIKHLLRSPSQIVFAYLFPLIEIIVFFCAVGGEPHGLTVGVVDKELRLSNKTECPKDMDYFVTNRNNGQCHFQLLSCKFLEKLPRGVETKIFFENRSQLLEEGKTGRLHATICFNDVFTETFVKSSTSDLLALSGNDVEKSQVLIHLDMTERQIGTYLKYKLKQIYVDFDIEARKLCNPDKVVSSTVNPIKILDPVYGEKEPKFEVFMIPGLVITLAFFLQTSLTSVTVILEKSEGLWDRNLAAGVTITEILLSHTVTQTFFSVTQTLLQMILVYWIYGITVQGCYVLLFVVIFLQSFCGQSLGFLISVCTNSILTANYVVTGSFYPAILLSGVLWPIEGMPKALQVLAKISPLTLSINALRNISEKGWNLDKSGVYWGILYPIIWIILLRITTLLVTLRNKK